MGHKTDDMIERNSVNVKLHDVDPTALRQLIDYAYTGEITISEDNVQVNGISLKIKVLWTVLFCFLFFFLRRHHIATEIAVEFDVPLATLC